MKRSENKNLCVYTGDEIRHRVYYDTDDNLTSRFVSIMGVTERVEGGLVLYLEGDNGDEYFFEFESMKQGGESVRGQFLYDLNICDIFDNIEDTDYSKSLVKKRIEAFVDREKDYVVAVSPIFMPLQNLPLDKPKRMKDLENIFYDMENRLNNIASAINIEVYKNPEGILIRQKNNIQNSIRHALKLKREHMQLYALELKSKYKQLEGGELDLEEPPWFSENYYEFIMRAQEVLNKIDEKLENPYLASLGLDETSEIEDSGSDFIEGNSIIDDTLLEDGDDILEDILGPERLEDEQRPT
jgi:hypothetical protein